MTTSPLVRVYSHLDDDYHDAFKEFLDHTDQKANAMAWLEREVASLSRRETFIDAGAGNGKLTTAFVPLFERVIAVEPNASLAADLRAACPSATVLPATIGEADLSARGDFVLCSHVFYYIDHGQWLANLQRLAGWLRPGGVLALALQNRETDCMHMVRHFTGRTIDLPALASAFKGAAGDRYDVRVVTVPARIRTDTFPSACAIAEFMMNVIPLTSPPPRAHLERYVEEHFKRPGGAYEFSCDQDFLRIRLDG